MHHTPLRLITLLALAVSLQSAAQSLESIVPNRLVVVYRAGSFPADADALAAFAGAHSATHLPHLGISALQINGDPALSITRLRSRPEIAAVLHDRYVTAHALQIQRLPSIEPLQPLLPRLSNEPVAPLPLPILRPQPHPILSPQPDPLPPTADTVYNSPQGWAVQQAGGYGARVPGGPAIGPWNTTLGAGVRIAILDSGIDAHHPDLAPNLALNLSEITADLPSPCDDGSPQDQQGHGSWVASLTAAAIGGGNTIGVAPQATLLNIKVLQRMPAATGTSLTAQCQSGQAAGLLSWVLKGIDDAIANHAGVISLSLGTLVDLTTADGAGWKAQFDAITSAAQQSGAVLIAALGNDGLNLSTTHFAELPAQARGVLAVVATTNPACAEDLTPNATCKSGPIARAYYSNFGPSINTIAAPGGSLPQSVSDTNATAPTGFIRGACSSGLTNTLDGLPADPNHSFGCFALGHTPYVLAIGTSASAPLVAGAAALLRAARPHLTAVQIVALLRSTATPTPSLTEPLLNLPAALTAPSP